MVTDSLLITRYFNVIGSDPEGRLGEAPRPELREHGRISGACFDAALGISSGLKVKICSVTYSLMDWNLLINDIQILP